MRLRTLACALGALLTLAPASAQQPPLETDNDKTLYALGLVLAQKISQFKLQPAEAELVAAGFRDGASGAEPRVALDVYGPQIDPMLRQRFDELMAEQKAAGEAYYQKFAQEPGVEKTESGILFQQIEAGSGPKPDENASVKVHYHGTLADGTVFDSSKQRNEPATFPLGGVIPCFKEGLQKLAVGGKAKIVCPSHLAYGPQGSPPRIPPDATLTFELELIEILPPAEPATP